MRKTIIEQATGNVVNVVMLGANSKWTPPTGQTIGADCGQIGDTWNGSIYVKPALPDAPPPTAADYAAAIQAHVDAVAQARQYNDGATLAGYATDPNADYAADAANFVTWRSSVWVYANAQLALVMSGQRPQPTIDQIVSELPEAPWAVA